MLPENRKLLTTKRPGRPYNNQSIDLQYKLIRQKHVSNEKGLSVLRDLTFFELVRHVIHNVLSHCDRKIKYRILEGKTK